MRVLVVENYPKTTLGQVGVALREARAAVDIVRTHLGEALPPTPAGFDALVMLGGAQDALDDANHPYLKQEAALARAFGEDDKAVLGICLGAQILARAYGATNILGRPLEFGWHEIRATADGRVDPVVAKIGAASPIFHWHIDTFTLPPDATHLATSAMTPMQAFRIGRAVYGIQFHFEADTGLVASWTEDFAAEISEYAPDWFERRPKDAAHHGPAADATGLALARAWVALAVPAARRSDRIRTRRENILPEIPA
jgi:GMP synthase (glutamine-hydrolysing)